MTGGAEKLKVAGEMDRWQDKVRTLSLKAGNNISFWKTFGESIMVYDMMMIKILIKLRVVPNAVYDSILFLKYLRLQVYYYFNGIDTI